MRPRYHFVGTGAVVPTAAAPPGRALRPRLPAARDGQGAGGQEESVLARRYVPAAPAAFISPARWLHALAASHGVHGRGSACRCAGRRDRLPVPVRRAARRGGGGRWRRRRGRRWAGGKRKRELPRMMLVGRTDCWFCMSSKKFDRISSLPSVSVRGAAGAVGLIAALVIPVAHKASSLELTDGESAEVEKYVGGLRKCFAAQGEELVLFERFMCRLSSPIPHPFRTSRRAFSVPLPLHSTGATRGSSTSTCRPSPPAAAAAGCARPSSSTALRASIRAAPRGVRLRDAMRARKPSSPSPCRAAACTPSHGHQPAQASAPRRPGSPRHAARRSAARRLEELPADSLSEAPTSPHSRAGSPTASSSSARTTRCARRAELGTIVPNPLAIFYATLLLRRLKRGPPTAPSRGPPKK